MPKTNEKDAYFFSHDCNARNDPKILALRSVYGAEGYGVYFMLVEILREQPEYKLPVTKYIWNTLAMQMQMEASRLEQIINDCCTEFSDGGDNTLLVNDGDFLYSASLLRRMGKVDDISKLRREAARKRWENQPCKDSGEKEPDANAKQEDSKEKKKKGKKSKAEQSKEKEMIFSGFAGDDAELLSALHDFEEMRVKIKKPMTDRAKKLLLTDLSKLASDRQGQIAILNQSIANCWAGVFALKSDAQRPQAAGKPRQASSSQKMDALRSLHSDFAEEGAGR